METEKHFIVHFRHLVLAYQHFLNFESSLECTRFNSVDLIASQIQFDEIWQATKKSIGFNAAELVVIQQTVCKIGSKMNKISTQLVIDVRFHLQFGRVQRNITWNFLQSTSGTVDGGSFAMTHCGTFNRFRSTIGCILAPQVLRACTFRQIKCQLSKFQSTSNQTHISSSPRVTIQSSCDASSLVLHIWRRSFQLDSCASSLLTISDYNHI